MNGLMLQELQNYSAVWRKISVEEAAKTSVQSCNTPALDGTEFAKSWVLGSDPDRLNLRNKLEWSVHLGCQSGHRSENSVTRNICWIQYLRILVKFLCQYIIGLCLHTVILHMTMIITFRWSLLLNLRCGLQSMACARFKTYSAV